MQPQRSERSEICEPCGSRAGEKTNEDARPWSVCGELGHCYNNEDEHGSDCLALRALGARAGREGGRAWVGGRAVGRIARVTSPSQGNVGSLTTGRGGQVVPVVLDDKQSIHPV